MLQQVMQLKDSNTSLHAEVAQLKAEQSNANLLLQAGASQCNLSFVRPDVTWRFKTLHECRRTLMLVRGHVNSVSTWLEGVPAESRPPRHNMQIAQDEARRLSRMLDLFIGALILADTERSGWQLYQTYVDLMLPNITQPSNEKWLSTNFMEINSKYRVQAVDLLAASAKQRGSGPRDRDHKGDKGANRHRGQGWASKKHKPDTE